MTKDQDTSELDQDEGVILRGGPHDGKTLRVPRGIPYWVMPRPLDRPSTVGELYRNFQMPPPMTTVRYVRSPTVLHINESNTTIPPGVWTVFWIDSTW